jgi:hypothetical protein
MTAVDLTWLFYTKRCEKISLVAAANGAATIIGNSRQNLGSGLIDYSQKMTMAAMQIADMNV